MEQETAEELCREYGSDPQALADALTSAAEADDDGYSNDATAVVLLRHTD
ncbi:hypothetical protein OG413_41500 [Streptomyces sp. NBC_01433]|nr:hypothetical protein [Streptomyces sp. NBC_01433]MCX4681680.1 hypothetical protein [Streptomyces sp. NBC_01433]